MEAPVAWLKVSFAMLGVRPLRKSDRLHPLHFANPHKKTPLHHPAEGPTQTANQATANS